MKWRWPMNQNNPLDSEKKNFRISARVGKSRKENFTSKCHAAGLSESQFLEKICDCQIIFVDNNAKEALRIMFNDSERRLNKK